MLATIAAVKLDAWYAIDVSKIMSEENSVTACDMVVPSAVEGWWAPADREYPPDGHYYDLDHGACASEVVPVGGVLAGASRDINGGTSLGGTYWTASDAVVCSGACSGTYR